MKSATTSRRPMRENQDSCQTEAVESRLVCALASLGDALDQANPSESESIDPVISNLELVQRLFETGCVEPEEHALIRRGVDNALAGLSGLVFEVQKERDSVGRELARIRRRRPVKEAAPASRLDCQT